MSKLNGCQMVHGLYLAIHTLPDDNCTAHACSWKNMCQASGM